MSEDENERFGELRSLLGRWDEEEIPEWGEHPLLDVLWDLIDAMADDDRERYDSEWRPYLTSFAAKHPNEIAFSSASLAELERLVELAPFAKICFSLGSEDTFEEAVTSPLMQHVEELTLEGWVMAFDADAWANAAHLSNLEVLNLRNYFAREIVDFYDVDGILGTLIETLPATHLTTLAIGFHQIGDAAAHAIASAEHLQHLTQLVITENSVRDAGIMALIDSPNLSNVTSMLLEVAPTDAILEELASAPAMARFDNFMLGQFPNVNSARERLAQSEHIAKIEHFKVF